MSEQTNASCFRKQRETKELTMSFEIAESIEYMIIHITNDSRRTYMHTHDTRDISASSHI
jgi:isopropylmalate/homocitrate/citramalate synthase